jgi:hypothetical protein
MDLERLLPFIMLLIFWGASSILRKMGKTDQKKQAPAVPKTDLLKILRQNLAVYEEEDNDEEFIDPDEYFQPIPEPLADEYEKESLIDIAQDSIQQEPATTGRETVSLLPPTGIAQPRSTILRKKPLAMMNRRKLQNAVVWAEILAPPVALRDQ